MTSTRTSRFVTRLSFAGLIGIGLAAGMAGTADAASDTFKAATTTTIKPGPQQPIDPDDVELTFPTDPCKVTHGAPKGCFEPDDDRPKDGPKDPCKPTNSNSKRCPKTDPCAPTPGGPEKCPESDPCAGDACDRPVPGKPTFTG